MRGRQSEKTTIKAKKREEEAEQRCAEEKKNKPLIIYLEDTSSSTFGCGQWCSAEDNVSWQMRCSVRKVFQMIWLVCTVWKFSSRCAQVLGERWDLKKKKSTDLNNKKPWGDEIWSRQKLKHNVQQFLAGRLLLDLICGKVIWAKKVASPLVANIHVTK